MSPTPIALITGSAKRIGNEITRNLHAQGYKVIVHCNQSLDDAKQFAQELNQIRQDSADIVQADLLDLDDIGQMVASIQQRYGNLDVLINNASTFYPTEVGQVTPDIWDDLMGTNLKAPFFLIQGLQPLLAKGNGCVINIVDIHAERPLHGYPIYCTAKAGLVMLTKSLSRELAPNIRVNGVAPGAILWHENELTDQDKASVLNEVSLKRLGSPKDIAQAVSYLVNAEYVTGHILAVDGGRSAQGGDKA